MATDKVGADGSHKGTNQFMRQGHTAGPYANQPTRDAKGQAGAPPQELKP
jgi:hypothetical protein